MTAWLLRMVMLSTFVGSCVLPVPTGAQPESESKESAARLATDGEPHRELTVPEPLDGPNEPEDRLVILPEIKREVVRHFLSPFKFTDNLPIPAATVPLDNWPVRERSEYECYQYLEDQRESIILAKRTGRCFPPV